MGNPDTIPLFPLNTVLFPYGHLYLRIFEPRYLAMVSERLKSDLPFGVVMIKEGNESGIAATFHETGTSARIVDFDKGKDGLLSLSCKGETRFQVTSYTVQADQLIVGNVQYLEQKNDQTDGAELDMIYDTVCKFVLQALEQMPHYRVSVNEEWNNWQWVSFQAAEFLPLSPTKRQLILKMDVRSRLTEIYTILNES